MAGFANAVLRKLAAARTESPEPPRKLVVPQAIAALLVSSLGPARAEDILEQRSLPPPMCLRVEQGERESLRARIREALPEAELQDCLLSPLGLALRRAGAPRSLPGYREGAFSVQEEGSQLVGLLLGAQPGERIADVCAGHGGKTTLFARQVGESGRVVAIDRDERKLEQIVPELARLGLPRERVSSLALDLTVGLGGLDAGFDRVLVDAPCTGLGTVHRRPELLVRLREGDPERLARLQRSILGRAAGLVRPGGLLAYAVCSPSAAEGTGVAQAFEAERPEFSRLRDAQAPSLPGPDADGITRIGPWLVQPGAIACPDAYQIVLWRRIR
jgi:16S rRNA (cytosine967-C5)-methyltransferase